MFINRWCYPSLLPLKRFLWGAFLALITIGGIWYKREYPDLPLWNILVWVFLASGGLIFSFFTPFWIINPTTKTLSCKRLPKTQSWNLSTTKLLLKEETSRNWRYETVSSYTVSFIEKQQIFPIATLSPSEYQELITFCQRFSLPYEEQRHA